MENKVELILEELAFHLETLISFWLLVLRRGFSYDNQFERSRRQCNIQHPYTSKLEVIMVIRTDRTDRPDI